MENVNKMLIIVGSSTIAIMLITLFTVFIGNVSSWPQNQDELANTEQIVAFNKEYEVFQKSAMYGVDVISCLNKAKSNNEKYVEGGSFLGDDAYGERYQVNVTIELKTKLSESISVTAIQLLGGTNKERTIYSSDIVENEYAGRALLLEEVFDINPDEQLTNFRKNDYLTYQMEKSNSGIDIGTKYNLLEHDVIEKLLGHANEPRQIVRNRDNPDNYVYQSGSPYGWTTATWTTYLYNFKQKRFKCTNLEYSAKTGRVNKLEFVEI